ncbi:MAG TPA: SH3 domain-containing protein [Rhodobacterales bacterium]|nr:SH3 domain-containing protein [Rhodobacterales bacterium]
MKRRTFVLSATSAFFAASLPAQAETLVVRSPGDGYLNLRTGPGTRYRIIRRMYNGSKVDVLEQAGNWVRVRHQSGDVGWASLKYLKRPNTKWRKVYSPRDGYLNLRRGPGTGYAIIMRMYNGERVKILDRKGKWRYVRHENGAKGWAYVDYLVR